MASTSGALVDDNVLEVLRKAKLDIFINTFVFQFNVRRFDHFSHVRDKEMQDVGMDQQQIRQLREQILKMSREMWNRSDPKQVYIAADQSAAQNSIDEKALIPNEQIRLYEQLGEGSFAVVKRGTWVQPNGQHVNVAVKILRDISPNIMDDLRVEASHLLKLQHPSLIRLYGIVRQPAMMVFELCEGGSLLDRLRDDKKSILLVSRLHDYCIQIAKALQFLESKHCVHRDVAARNILLSKDEKTVKICDFGLMRALKENEQMYTMAPQKKVPFAWCPPEALRHRKFSHASDVWSYGVTIWELFTFGEEPWVGCRAIDVLKNIDAGERLEKPKYCSERIYQIMKDCWKTNPAERCKFGAIREDLKAAMFLDAIARETYNSIQPGTLQLVKGDEVVVIENTGIQDWFGQNKKNQQFGTFPRSVVFAQTNHAVAAATAVTPQKVPTAPTIRVQPQQPIPMPITSKPLNNNTKTSLNDRTSRISMPVAGSFIHTGHGDPLGGQSWGNPSTIDDMYLKNPVKGAPLSSMSNGAQVIASKELLTNGGRSTHTPAASSSTSAMPKTRGLSLDLPEYDDFDRAFDDGFSPSKIELPRAFGSGNDSIISNDVNFRAEDLTNIIEAPKPTNPTFDIRGNVLQPIPIAKIQAPASTPRPILLAPTSSGVVTMQLPDKFTTSQPHSSVPIIDQSRNQPRSSPRIDPVVPQQRTNMPSNLIPELQHRLNSDIGMRPRPASSIGIQNNSLDTYNPQVHRPFSVVNAPTVPIVQQPASIPCLVPTPAPIPQHAPKPTTSQQQNPLQKALTDELKGNLSRRPTNVTSNGNGVATQRNGASQNSQPMSQPALQPQKLNPVQSQQQQVRLPPPATAATIAPTPAPHTTTVAPTKEVPRPAPVPVQANKTSAPAQPTVPTTSSNATSTTNGTSSAQNVVIRRSTQTVNLSAEERRSKIIQDISSALPAPSHLLYGSSSTSSLPTTAPSTSSATPVNTVRDRPTQVPVSQPSVTMPPKKTSEPILSTEVLQPTRLPTASVAKPSQPTPQPVRNPSPPVVNNSIIADKKATIPNQSTNVPLYNITNSTNLYPQLNTQPNYGNGYTPYGYGMQYNPGYPYGGYTPYNPYMSGMGQLALTNSAVSSLPPLHPSENRHSGTAQPLDESGIRELLGSQNRDPVVQPTPQAAPRAATSTATSSQSSARSNDLNIADRMEVLYKEAEFTDSGNCDSMVTHCKGDFELALKLLKQNHLMQLGLAKTPEQARQALESRQYDLTAACNYLLG
uniref:non-specific protein-tyrosine kinase n=1 Tax=Caenorhabditis tropicalis TaxID=1561998 RepID=A0A1I7U072_9PELO